MIDQRVLPRLPDGFTVLSPLADVMNALDAFAQALVAPPRAPEPLVPPGYTRTWGEAMPPGPGERRAELTTLLVAGHFALVNATMEAKQWKGRYEEVLARASSAEKSRDRVTAELSTAMHTIEQLQARIVELTPAVAATDVKTAECTE